MKPQIFGGIEGGGTKFVCAIGDDSGRILQQARVPTTTPDETLAQVIAFFEPFVLSGELSRIGLGSFGPFDVNAESPTYGYITSTPKVGWQFTDISGRLKSALKADFVLDMDVNAAAFGEFTWGASRGLDSSLYMTIGTGIGGGYIVGGKPLHGLLSPEMGHIRLLHDWEKDPFPGNCPYHGDCFEGLASGPAINKRMGRSGETLGPRHHFWDLEAGYIGEAVSDLILVLSPRKIILGGGVMKRGYLFPRIRNKVSQILNGYVQHAALLEQIDSYIVPPALGSNAGVLGAIALAAHG